MVPKAIAVVQTQLKHIKTIGTYIDVCNGCIYASFKDAYMQPRSRKGLKETFQIMYMIITIKMCRAPVKFTNLKRW